MNDEKGYILSYLKYGDNDAIINSFTEREGFSTFFVKNIYGKGSRKQKAFLLPLCLVEFKTSSSKTQSSSMKRTNKIELVEAKDIYEDIKTNTILFFIADILNQVLKNENSNSQVFLEINNLLCELEKNSFQAHLIFLINLLKALGIAPLSMLPEYLNPESGTFETSITHPLFTKLVSNLWKNILYNEECYNLRISTADRKILLDSILMYYSFHIENFKKPISLEVINEIFST